MTRAQSGAAVPAEWPCPNCGRPVAQLQPVTLRDRAARPSDHLWCVTCAGDPARERVAGSAYRPGGPLWW